MTCRHCGAPLELTQRFCPNCGAANEAFQKHIEDMDRYHHAFRKTQKEVVSNSRWFVKYIAPLVVMTVSIAIAAVCWAGRNDLWGYVIADQVLQAENKKHETQIQIRLQELLAEKNYMAMYQVYQRCDWVPDNAPHGAGWSNFYELSYEYGDLRRYILAYYDESQSGSYSYENAFSRASACIVQIEETLAGKYTANPDAEQALEPLEKMKEDYRTFLQVYCGLTETDLAGLADQDQPAVLALLTRRMADENE